MTYQEVRTPGLPPGPSAHTPSVFPAEGLGTEMCREGLEPTRLERDRPPSPPTRIPTYTDPTAQAPGAGPGSAGPPGHQAEPSPGWSRRGEGRHLARTPQGGPARGTVQTRRTYPTLRLQSLTGLGLKFSRHPVPWKSVCPALDTTVLSRRCPTKICGAPAVSCLHWATPAASMKARQSP